MSTVICGACDETVPAARLCTECNEVLNDDIVPSVEEYKSDFTTRMSDVALDAAHDSITFDALRSEYDKYDRPLGGYLFPSEQPEAVCELHWSEVSDDADYSSKISSGLFNDGHLLITEERVIAILPGEEDAQVFATGMADIIDSGKSSSWRKSLLRLSLADGFTVRHEVDVDGDVLNSLNGILRVLADQYDSAESQAAKFINAVDDEVSTASDAETVLRNVADLFEERDELTQFDHAVANADSLDELLVALAASGVVGESAGDSTPDNGEEDVVTMEDHAPKMSLRVRASETIKNAEPEEVAKYTLAAALGGGAYAISAPFSTTLGLAALAAGGTATGLYASANPESIVARIDPMVLAMNMTQRGQAVEQSSMAGSKNTGMALGALEYLGSVDYDTEYAKWLAEADFDTVIRGAELAQQHAEDNPALGTPREASMLGGLGGLAYGYTGFDGDVETMFDMNAKSVEE